ncbi:DUF1566 domain-containing protein [Desulfococcaceae bacterium HSG9]|nr:DUF1566 domain-containing protein [Desulfococcaceae bacterium HSG9]
MPTLQEVYDYLMNGTAETPDTTFQGPSTAPGSTMKTTREIYDDIKAEFDQCTSATPDKIQSGVKFFSTDTAKWGVQNGTMPFAAVPKTGAAICFDKVGTSRTCAGTGEDGEHKKGAALPNPRFTDNSDGTVTDNMTGLIWLKDANCMLWTDWQTALYNIGKSTDGAGVSLNSGKDFSCTDYTAGAFDDWRLPNAKELQSLIHYGYSSSTLSDAAGTDRWSEGDAFTGVSSVYYWSSTSKMISADEAFVVGLGRGVVHLFGKSDKRYVWPVRGGQ